MRRKNNGITRIEIIIIVVSLIFLISIGGMFLLKQKSGKIGNSGQFYKITYSATIDTENLISKNNDLNKDEYEIIDNAKRLNEILNPILNKNELKEFDNNFFEKKKIILVQAGINPKMEKIDINNAEANVLVYTSSPLISRDEKLDFELYLIPVSRNVENVNVEIKLYPDVVF